MQEDPMHIVLINGPPRSGKDTAARMLFSGSRRSSGDWKNS